MSRRNGRRFLTLTAITITGVLLSAQPALASRRTPTTTQSGYCNLDGFAIPHVSFLLLKRVDFGGHADCYTWGLPAEIIVQSHLYDGSSRVAFTSLARCFDCFEVSVISSYNGLATKTYRAETDLTVHLDPFYGERFQTPVPSCTVYNGGYSIYCHLTDYA